MKTSPYLKLERRIAADERGGILERWRYGQQLLEAKTGRQQLPHGMLNALIKSAEKRGFKLSETEIRRRIRCAEAYETEAEVGRAATDFEGWWDLVTVGFPPVEIDQIDPEDIQAEGLGEPSDSWEQMQLDIPGLKEEIAGVGGRRVKLVRGEEGGTIADVAAYLQMCEEMHENFGKTVELIRESLETMREGADDDDGANAVEAWEAATEGDPEEAEDEAAS